MQHLADKKKKSKPHLEEFEEDLDKGNDDDSNGLIVMKK